MSHRVYLYNSPTIGSSTEGEMLLEIGYDLPLFFVPLFASKTIFAPTHCNSGPDDKDGIFSDRDTGIEQLKKLYNFIELNIGWINRPDQFLEAKSQIFEYLDRYIQHPFFELDATDVFNMDEIDHDIQAQELYSKMQRFNSEVFEAIDKNDPTAFGEAFTKAVSGLGFQDFIEYLNYDYYGYGWDILEKDFFEAGEKGSFYFENEKWGLKGAKGLVVLEPQFEHAWSFQEDLNVATVKKDGKQGVLNRAGKLIVPCEYNEVYDFEKKSGIAVVENDGLFGCIDLNNKIIIPIIYEDASQFTSVVFLMRNDLFAIYNRDHEPLSEFVFYDYNFEWFDLFENYEEERHEFVDRYFQVKQEGKWGVYDAKENKLVVVPAFDEKLDLHMHSEYHGHITIKAIAENGQEIWYYPDFSVVDFGENTKVPSFYRAGSHLLAKVQKGAFYGLYNLTEKSWECEPVYAKIEEKEHSYYAYSSHSEIVFQVSTTENKSFLYIIEKEKKRFEDLGMIRFRLEETHYEDLQLMDVLVNWEQETVENVYVFRFREKNKYGLFLFAQNKRIPVLDAVCRTITDYNDSRDGLYTYVEDKKTGLVSIIGEVQNTGAIFDYLHKDTRMFFGESGVFKLYFDRGKDFQLKPFLEVRDSLSLNYWREHWFFPPEWQSKIDEQLAKELGLESQLEVIIAKYCSDSAQIKRLAVLLEGEELEDLDAVESVMQAQYSKGDHEAVLDLYDYLAVFTRSNGLYECYYPEYLMGLSFRECGEDEKAIIHLKKAIQYHEYAYDAYSCLGWTYVEREEYDKALKIVNTALQLSKKAKEINDFDQIIIDNLPVIQAAVHHLREEYVDSYAFFKNETIAKIRHAFHYWRFRAMSFLKYEHTEESLQKGQDFLDFLERTGYEYGLEQFFVMIEMADCLVVLERKSDALALLERVKELEPEHNDWLERKIKTVKRNGRSWFGGF